MGLGLCQALLQVFSHSSSGSSRSDTEREPQGDQVTQPMQVWSECWAGSVGPARFRYSTTLHSNLPPSSGKDHTLGIFFFFHCNKIEISGEKRRTCVRRGGKRRTVGEKGIWEQSPCPSKAEGLGRLPTCSRSHEEIRSSSSSNFFQKI